MFVLEDLLSRPLAFKRIVRADATLKKVFAPLPNLYFSTVWILVFTAVVAAFSHLWATGIWVSFIYFSLAVVNFMEKRLRLNLLFGAIILTTLWTFYNGYVQGQSMLYNPELNFEFYLSKQKMFKADIAATTSNFFVLVTAPNELTVIPREKVYEFKRIYPQSRTWSEFAWDWWHRYLIKDFRLLVPFERY